MINYTITNKIVAKLEKIHSIWGVIENAKIVPEWEKKLKKIARLRSSVFSTKIEGNQISLKAAEKFLENKPIKAKERDKQELKNYIKVLDYIEIEEKKKKITQDHIFRVHSLTTKKILSQGLQNKYRKQQNAIYSKNGALVYMPPEWSDVPGLMKKLLVFINNKKEISPLIRAAILHHWFVIIHPFVDGNGRTARALTQLFLYQNGFNTKKYFSLEEYYDTDLKNYYDNISIGSNFYSSMEVKVNSTKFIEYFLTGLFYELNRLKKQIKVIKEDEKFEETINKSGLTNRQLHFVIFIKQKKNTKSSDFLKKFKISLATIKRELKVLLDKKIIVKKGIGKNTYYEPKVSRK